MDFELAEEHRMLKDLVSKFVRDELMPLENNILERDANGKGAHLSPEERARRVHSKAFWFSRISVCTNRLLNAG